MQKKDIYMSNGVYVNTDFVKDILRNDVVYLPRARSMRSLFPIWQMCFHLIIQMQSLRCYQASYQDGRAVGFMCVVLNVGFHSDEYSLLVLVVFRFRMSHIYPVYTGVVGKYVCTLCVVHYKDVRVFSITSEFQSAVHCIIMASCSNASRTI